VVDTAVGDNYSSHIAGIQRSAAFDRWLNKLRDARGKAIILIRIERLAGGNPGDVEPVGEGVTELRIHVGPGYRIYDKIIGRMLILLLDGGDKSTQVDDIAEAKRIANDWSNHHG
jgi:putative addiction module killer protein